MTNPLNERIAALHAELSNTESVDAQGRELLMALLSDIARLLGEPDIVESLDNKESQAERLEGLAVQFEAEHPAVAQALRQVVDALAKAGI